MTREILKIGDTVEFSIPTGGNFGMDMRTEKHTVKSIEVNPYNEIVPSSFETCCGKYIPSSASDGYFENFQHYGGWEIIRNIESPEL